MGGEVHERKRPTQAYAGDLPERGQRGLDLGLALGGDVTDEHGVAVGHGRVRFVKEF